MWWAEGAAYMWWAEGALLKLALSAEGGRVAEALRHHRLWDGAFGRGGAGAGAARTSYSSFCTTRTERGVPSSSRKVIVPALFDVSMSVESAFRTCFFSRRDERGRELSSAAAEFTVACGIEPSPSAGIAGLISPLLPSGRLMLKADGGAVGRACCWRKDSTRDTDASSAPVLRACSFRKESSRERGDIGTLSPAAACWRAAMFAAWISAADMRLDKPWATSVVCWWLTPRLVHETASPLF